MSTAQDRGWGAPPVPRSRIVTIRTGDVLLPVHTRVAALVRALCDETQRRGYTLVDGWCWGYAPRPIAGSTAWSNHAWGLAVDLNAPKNPMGSRLVTDMPAWMPRMWEEYGFRWGGRYVTRPDAMHYEFMGTPAQASAYAARAAEQFTTDPEELTVADIDNLLKKLRHLDDHLHQIRDEAGATDRRLRRLEQRVPGNLADEVDEIRRNLRDVAYQVQVPLHDIEGDPTADDLGQGDG